MPVVESSVNVPVDVATAFAVSQTTGAVRRRWDPFIREGSWFFERLGGGWRFIADEAKPGHTRAVWRYNFVCKPPWLAPLAERIGAIVLQRDIDRRIAGFARGCGDPEVLAAVRA